MTYSQANSKFYPHFNKNERNMFKIIIKDTANIVYDKENRIFLVKFEEIPLNEEALAKIRKVFYQLVTTKVYCLLDTRNVTITGKILDQFLAKQLSNTKLLGIFLIINNLFKRTYLNVQMLLNQNNAQALNIQFFYSLEKALDTAKSLANSLTEALSK